MFLCVRPRRSPSAAAPAAPTCAIASLQRLEKAGAAPGRAPRSARRSAPGARQRRGHLRDVARIELDVRIACGMDVAVAAIEPRRHVERHDEATGLEIPRRARARASDSPDCWSSTGSQPTSSSMPVQTSRSALRMRAIRLGRASMRCGSCKRRGRRRDLELVAAQLLASDAHSGSQATTLRRRAPAGESAARAASSKGLEGAVSWRCLLERVRAVRAQAHDVLKEDLAVGLRPGGCGRRRTAGAGG